MTNEIPMKVVQHPNLEDVKYTVPAEDAPRWEKQGWKVTDDQPMAPGPASEGVDLTVAQKAGLGLLPVAGQVITPDPVSTPTVQEAPTAADAAPASTSTTATAPASTTSTPTPTGTATADQPKTSTTSGGSTS